MRFEPAVLSTFPSFDHVHLCSLLLCEQNYAPLSSQVRSSLSKARGRRVDDDYVAYFLSSSTITSLTPSTVQTQ
jgi:hypothetical protein